MPSAVSVSSNARRASSGRWKPLLSLLVTNTSARSRPASRMPCPTPRLVPVHLGGVDVPVADLQRGLDRFGCFFGRDLEHAERQLWDLAPSGSSIRGTLLKANLLRTAHGVSVTL